MTSESEMALEWADALVRNLQKERDAYKRLVQMQCEEIEECRTLAEKVIGEYEARGDSYGVPTIVDIVELLVTKLNKEEMIMVSLKEALQHAERPQNENPFYKVLAEAVRFEWRRAETWEAEAKRLRKELDIAIAEAKRERTKEIADRVDSFHATYIESLYPECFREE